MQLAHALGGLDVDRVLFLVGRGLIPGDEPEQPDIPVQILERKFMLRAVLKIVQAEAGKIGNQNVGVLPAALRDAL